MSSGLFHDSDILSQDAPTREAFALNKAFEDLKPFFCALKEGLILFTDNEAVRFSLLRCECGEIRGKIAQDIIMNLNQVGAKWTVMRASSEDKFPDFLTRALDDNLEAIYGKPPHLLT